MYIVTTFVHTFQLYEYFVYINGNYSTIVIKTEVVFVNSLLINKMSSILFSID